jgi:hypothetical protein
VEAQDGSPSWFRLLDIQSKENNMRKLFTTMYWLALALVLPVDRLSAAAYAPPVTMSIKTPDGHTQEVTAPESGLATLKLKDGREFGFRPTMQDDKGNRVSVTVFEMTDRNIELGTVETGLAKPEMKSKTTPVFGIRVTKVEPQKPETADTAASPNTSGN